MSIRPQKELVRETLNPQIKGAHKLKWDVLKQETPCHRL